MARHDWAAAGLMALMLFSGEAAQAQPAGAPHDQALAGSIDVAIHGAETMAVNSGQPAQYVVFEIAKAIRDVVWSSGEKPAAILKALALAKTPDLSTQAQQAIGLIEREMAD